MRSETKRVTGPIWICEIDQVDQLKVIGGDFPTREDAIKFMNANPGNASLFQLGAGRVCEYIVEADMPHMKSSYDAWQRQLQTYGSSE